MKRFGPAMAILVMLSPAAALAQPAPIADFAGSAWSQTSITLSWTSPGAQSYDVRLSMIDPYAAEVIDPSVPSVSAWYDDVATRADGEPGPAAAGTQDTMEIPGLTAGMLYVIAITSTDAAGQSAISVTYEWTLTPPPQKVTSLEVSKLSQSYVTLKWLKPEPQPTTCRFAYSTVAEITDANFETVYAQHHAGPTSVDISDPMGTWVSFKLTGLQMTTHYWIAARSSDGTGAQGPVSTNVEVITLDVDQLPPNPIIDLDLMEAYTEDHAAYLICTVPEDLGGGDVWTIELKVSTDGRIDDLAKFNAATRACWKDHYNGVGEAGTIVVLPATGLEAGTKYWFSARVGDNSDHFSGVSNSDQSVVLPADTTPPATPILLPGGWTRTTSVSLKWDVVWDDEYDLRYSPSLITEQNFDAAARDLSAKTPGLPGFEIPGVGQHLVTGLLPQTSYYFAIKAVDRSGNKSAMSNVVVMSTLEAIPPDAINTLNVQSVGPSHVWLEWKATGDDGRVGTASSYMIKASTNDPATHPDWWSSAWEVGHAQVSGPFGTPESYGVYILLSGAEICWFAIKAVDDVGNESAISNIVRCGGYVGDLGLLQTGDLTTVKTLSKSVTLAWTAPVGAKSYGLRYSTQRPGASMGDWLNHSTPALSMPQPGPPGTSESARVDGLVPSTEYYFVRLAFDAAGNVIEYSNELLVETHPADPAPPAVIGDLAVSLPQSTYLLLTWTAPGDDDRSGTATRYELRWSPNDPGGAPTEEWWAHGATSIQVSTPVRGILPAPALAGSREYVRIDGLTPDTTYHFVIRALDDDENWSPIGIPLAAATEPRDVVPPAAITTLRADEVPGTGDVVLTWAAEGEDGAGSPRAVERYEIRYSNRAPESFESPASWWSHATPYVGEIVPPLMPGALQTATLRDLAPHQYFIAVIAIDEAPNASDFSNTASIITFPIGSQQDGKVCSASPCAGWASCGLLAVMALWIRMGRRS